jgi:hypothetical protein
MTAAIQAHDLTEIQESGHRRRPAASNYGSGHDQSPEFPKELLAARGQSWPRQLRVGSSGMATPPRAL